MPCVIGLTLACKQFDLLEYVSRSVFFNCLIIKQLASFDRSVSCVSEVGRNLAVVRAFETREGML
jgi:hypothetical protein